MQREQGHRTSQRNMRTLDLPPPFRPVALREVGDAFAHACAHAVELGAGTLVFVGRLDLAEFAVILEPEEPLATARRAFYVCMVALSDAPAQSMLMGVSSAAGGLVGRTARRRMRYRTGSSLAPLFASLSRAARNRGCTRVRPRSQKRVSTKSVQSASPKALPAI